MNDVYSRGRFPRTRLEIYDPGDDRENGNCSDVASAKN
jgi:hypothetical protein